MTPKVFISYSWTDQSHQDRVREWAERLISEGVDVVLDQYDLKEGQDKYAFMERMVTDPEVTHVLVVCDKAYSEKADARQGGVGTESQIVSKEVYDKVDQSKFIPIACEFADEDTPYLPIFLKSRIWIDFSTSEAVNGNWEKLIRRLFGKPLYEKPTLGKPPAYLADGSAAPASPVRGKFSALRQAILQGKKGIGLYRRDFLDACIEYADSLRVRERPEAPNLGAKILEDCGKLVHMRDHIVDWVLLESEALPSQEFSEALMDVLERLNEQKFPPSEIGLWMNAWSEAHRLFVYETFLYVVAALLETRSYQDLHNVFASHYLLPAHQRRPDAQFRRFYDFYAYSDTLNSVLAPEGQRYRNPAAELISRQAQREDLPFADIMQADLLILMMALITPDARWYPQTLHYTRYGTDFPFFVRASRHKDFQNLVVVTGIQTADVLRRAVEEGWKKLGTGPWHDLPDLWACMNLDKLDTIG